MVWLNGAFLGASKDSRLPAEFEVTERLQHGKNLLAVQVRCGAVPLSLCQVRHAQWGLQVVAACAAGFAAGSVA